MLLQHRSKWFEEGDRMRVEVKEKQWESFLHSVFTLDLSLDAEFHVNTLPPWPEKTWILFSKHKYKFYFIHFIPSSCLTLSGDFYMAFTESWMNWNPVMVKEKSTSVHIITTKICCAPGTCSRSFRSQTTLIINNDPELFFLNSHRDQPWSLEAEGLLKVKYRIWHVA